MYHARSFTLCLFDPIFVLFALVLSVKLFHICLMLGRRTFVVSDLYFYPASVAAFKKIKIMIQCMIPFDAQIE